VRDYKYMGNNLDGVGGYRVYPVWNGGGTVKVIIVNAQYNTCGRVRDDLQAVAGMIAQIIPCNLIRSFDLLYNQYKSRRLCWHTNLHFYTHNYSRNEVMP